MKKKYAKMCFKAEIKDTDTDDTIVERMFNEIESYLDVIGIRRDLIEIVEEDEPNQNRAMIASKRVDGKV